MTSPMGDAVWDRLTAFSTSLDPTGVLTRRPPLMDCPETLGPNRREYFRLRHRRKTAEAKAARIAQEAA